MEYFKIEQQCSALKIARAKSTSQLCMDQNIQHFILHLFAHVFEMQSVTQLYDQVKYKFYYRENFSEILPERNLKIMRERDLLHQKC